jgi:hypothetical protein
MAEKPISVARARDMAAVMPQLCRAAKQKRPAEAGR